MEKVKVKATLGSLERAAIVLQKCTGSEMKARTAYFLAKTMIQVSAEVDEMYKIKQKLFEKYCKRDEDGNPVLDKDTNDITIDKDQYKEFESEIISLYETEVEIEVLPVSLEMLDSLDGISLTPNDLVALMPFIQDDDPC